ncbi:MAG: O-antigen ligase family protein [candidate division KSB1 bacterium]|nr:O-antigen ligase family protein [candidate division KSB1 bacterium]MDZ7393568.1 O-antigen ligase family protein [candidate division KSB1 bacterium]
MNQISALYFLLAFCGTVTQGLWVAPLNTEAILIMDIPLFLLFVLGRNRRPLSPAIRRILPIMVLFLLWPVAGIPGAVDKQAAIASIITNVRALLICVAVMLFVNTRQDMRALLAGLSAGLLFQGLVAILQFRFGYVGLSFLGEQGRSWRASGTLGHPNVLAMYTMMLTPLAYRMGVFGQEKYRWLFLTAFLVGVAALFASQGRACWLGFALSMVTFFFVDLKKRRVVSRRTIGIWVLLAIVGVFGAFKYRTILTGRFTGAEEELVGQKTSSRLYLAKDALRIIKGHPIFGVGQENYKLHAGEEILGDKFVHCSYLLVAAEAGVPGLILLLAILGTMLVFTARLAQAKDPFVSNVGTGVLTALVALTVALLPSPDYRIVWVKNHVWLLFGLGLALGKIAYHDERRMERLRALGLLGGGSRGGGAASRAIPPQQPGLHGGIDGLQW